MMAAFWKSGNERFERRDTENARLESLALHKKIKEMNKNMAKKDYTAQDVIGMIFAEICEMWCVHVYMCPCVYMLAYLQTFFSFRF